MGFDGLPNFVVGHLQRIANQEGFLEGYDVKQQAGSNVGDGFNSNLWSIKLFGLRRKKTLSGEPEHDELALMCKLLPIDISHQENFDSERLFQQEVNMYNNILPDLAEFQKERGFKENELFKCYPKCYVAVQEKGNTESLIILEDIRVAGFEMWNKRKPLDVAYVRLLLEQIGRLHGLSIAIRHQKPELFQRIQDLPPIIIDFISTPGVTSMLETSLKQRVLLAENSKDVEALEHLSNNWRQVLLDGVNAELLGKYGVLSHGDCWINNMMFAMDEESQLKSITLLDWQLSRVTSPASDLTFFLFTSTEKSMRDEHLDEFLQIYYSNLARTIRASGSDPAVLFPEAELQQQLRQFGAYGVMLGPILIPAILADFSESNAIGDTVATVDESIKDLGPVINLDEIKEKESNKRIKDVLEDARRYGWLQLLTLQK